MDLNVTLFGEILTFSVLLIVVVKVIWPRLLSQIQHRQKLIDEGLVNFDQSKQILALAEEEGAKRLQKVKAKVVTILEQAHQQANLIVEEGVQLADLEKKRLLRQVEADINYQVKQVQRNLQQQEVALITHALDKVLAQTVDAQIHQQLIKQIIREL